MAGRIIIEAIPQTSQRYDTLGDWFFDTEGDLRIRVTGRDMLEKESALIGLHELVEAILCFHRGITEAQVDKFDFAFDGHGEPGDDPDAPYRKEHRFAMIVEHMTAHELGVVGYGHIE